MNEEKGTDAAALLRARLDRAPTPLAPPAERRSRCLLRTAFHVGWDVVQRDRAKDGFPVLDVSDAQLRRRQPASTFSTDPNHQPAGGGIRRR